MNNGQATVLAEQRAENLNGILLDARGEIAQKEPHTLMDKIDAKASQDITVKRGTLWFVGTVLVLAGVVFSYGSSAVSWIRNDESQKMQIQQLQNDVSAVKDNLKSLTLMIEQEREARRQQEIQNAKALGYQLKAAEGDDHGAKK